MHEEKDDKCGHREEMDLAGAVIATEKCRKALELNRFPDRNAREHKQNDNPDDGNIQDALDRVVFARAMKDEATEFQSNVVIRRHRLKANDLAPEMAGEHAINEICDAVDREQPHGGEVPGKRAGEPSAKRDIRRKLKRVDGRRIINPQPAHQHDDGCEGIYPMGNPHEERMDNVPRLLRLDPVGRHDVRLPLLQRLSFLTAPNYVVRQASSVLSEGRANAISGHFPSMHCNNSTSISGRHPAARQATGQ